MQLTDHFTLEEMQNSATAINKNLNNTIPDHLIPNAKRVAEALEIIRAHFNAPVRVLSCYRSPVVNGLVGGSKTSAHRYALAADFVVDGVAVKDVAEACVSLIPDYDQVICEFKEWVHLGFTGGTPRRQALAASKVNGSTEYSQLA